MAKWYVRRGEKVIGPVDIAKLREAVATGALLPTDQLSNDAGGPWTQASDTRLFAKESAEPPRLEPAAGELVPSVEHPLTQDVPPDEGGDQIIIFHAVKVFVVKVGHGALAAGGGVARFFSTRAQRRHELKLAERQRRRELETPGISRRLAATAGRGRVHRTYHGRATNGSKHGGERYSNQRRLRLFRVRVGNSSPTHCGGCAGSPRVFRSPPMTATHGRRSLSLGIGRPSPRRLAVCIRWVVVGTLLISVFCKPLAFVSISAYQQLISPHKGWCCAYAALHGGPSCSAYGKEAISRHGVLVGMWLLWNRFDDCRAAANTFAAAQPGKECADGCVRGCCNGPPRARGRHPPHVGRFGFPNPSPNPCRRPAGLPIPAFDGGRI